MFHHTKVSPVVFDILLWLVGLLSSFILPACHFRSPDDSCARFRKGDFSLTYKNHPESGTFLITRNDSVQTEINHQTGNYSKLSIFWSSACTYQLRLMETSEKISDNERMYRMLYPMEVEIVQSTDRYYLFKCKRFRDKDWIRDTIWVRK